MTQFKPADGGTNSYALGDALNAALRGSKLTGFTAEVSSELARKHGSEGVRIPLAAFVAQTKATGASPLIGGASPLLGYDLEGGIQEMGGAIRAELLAGKFGVSTRSTDQAEYRIPYVGTKPTATIVDVDAAIPDQGGSTFDYLSVRPVIAGSLIEVANSLDFTNPDCVSVISRQIVDTVTETIDKAFIDGYGPTPAGRSFAGLAAVAMPSSIPLSASSTLSGWASVKEVYSAYTKSTDISRAKWLMHPKVADSTLSTSPVFAGSTQAIATGRGIDFLLGAPVVQGRLPILPNQTTPIFFGEPGEIFLILFNSASISLVANPYEQAAFAKGSTLLRVMVSFGMRIRDAQRLVKADVQL